MSLIPISRKHQWRVLVASLICMAQTARSADEIFAATPVGTIQGTTLSTPAGQRYHAFLGVPYAKPPVGELRWKLPQPSPRFESLYEATAFPPGCPQVTSQVTSEDCLYLDVYVPGDVTGLYVNVTEALEAADREGAGAPSSSLGTGARLPVLVWIHGGAYHSGSSRGTPAWKVATEQNIVVVVIQYRLGALGFLSTGDKRLPGNFGLWDQRLALQWVQTNVRGLGGDVAMVTIAGESAGATSVSQHTVSRQSSGLFRRAVMLSGTVDAGWCFQRHPRPVFDTFSVAAGCGDGAATPSLDSTLRCLMNVSADDIHTAAVTTEAGNFVTFVPNFDHDFFPYDDIHTLLSDEAYLTSVGYYDYDVLVAFLNDEGVIALSPLMQLAPEVESTFRVPYAVVDGALLELLLTQELGDSVGPDTKDLVNYGYFYPRGVETGVAAASSSSSAPLQSFLDLYTDGSFTAPSVKYLRRRAEAVERLSSSSSSSTSSSTQQPPSSSNPTPSSNSYLLYFDWQPALVKNPYFQGMPHGLDVDYLFGLNDASLILYGVFPLGGAVTPQEHNVSRAYGDVIGAFVRTGNPNNGLTPGATAEEWTSYDTQNETFLRFSPTPAVDHHVLASRTSLWLDIVPRLQSRWIQNLASNENSGQSTTMAAILPLVQSEKLTDFGVSESEANTMLISLLVVAVVLLAFNLLLLFAFLRVSRKKKESKYEMRPAPRDKVQFDDVEKS